MKYKELWEQMCQRCDELDKKLANQEQPPIGFITNARHRLNFEPNATGLKDMPKTVDWKIPVYTHPQLCKPLTLEQLREHWQVAKVLDMTDAEIDFADYVLIVRDVEALYGIKE
jgi:hypothetical protein